MKRVFWLASYPKSGNTWFRAFLASLTNPSGHAVDINNLNTGLLAGARTPFDEIAGVEASDLTADEIDRLRPRIYRQLAEEADRDLYHKVHDAYTALPAGGMLLPADVTAGAIYVLRNPLDVAVSFAHHANRSLEQVIEWMGDETYCLSGNGGEMSRQLRQRLLSWSGHVQSWVDQQDFPICVVRYEDMHLDAEATFTRAAAFAGLPSDAGRIRQAIRASSFDELRRQEQAEGFNERSPVADSFFRRGETGAWRATLTEEQAARIIARHEGVMRRFGYLDDSGAPVF